MQTESYGRQRNVRTRRRQRLDRVPGARPPVRSAHLRQRRRSDRVGSTLRGLKAQGVRYVPAHLRDEAREGHALGVLASAFVEHKRIEPKASGELIAAEHVRVIERAMHWWVAQLGATTPVEALSVAMIDSADADARRSAPAMAHDRRKRLKQLLRFAQSRDIQVPPAVASLPVGRKPKRRAGIVLDSFALVDRVATEMPSESMATLVWLHARLGNRIGELLLARRQHLHVDERELYVPAEHCKERREKWIPLEQHEVERLAAYEARLPEGETALFPKRSGGHSSRTNYREDYWQPGGRTRRCALALGAPGLDVVPARRSADARPASDSHYAHAGGRNAARSRRHARRP